ncbi:hypothetical protein HZH68_014976 [Vespula germanica]|uniref:Uncharacterized protein n=1 Tax=Vespula germanica TaxID=30212 RepID=A0A834J9L9_VESGE|nr:hypothetical protein HZH68_014976 [Vespula germanica]
MEIELIEQNILINDHVTQNSKGLKIRFKCFTSRSTQENRIQKRSVDHIKISQDRIIILTRWFIFSDAFALELEIPYRVQKISSNALDIFYNHKFLVLHNNSELQRYLQDIGINYHLCPLQSDTGKLEMEEFKNILVTLLTRRFDLNSNIEIVHDIVSKLLKGYLSIPKISATSKRLFFMTRNIHLLCR